MVLPDLRVLLLAGLEDPSPQRNCPFLELQQTFSMCQPGALQGCVVEFGSLPFPGGNSS